MTCRLPTLIAALFGLFLVGHPAAVLAVDPLTLFLLRVLRDQALTSAIESVVEQPPAVPAPVAPYVPPPASSEAQRLKALIDEAFIHLAPAQRENLHESLQKMLSDPRNAQIRSQIITEFTRQANEVRDAHRQLSRLSEADMRRIAADAREEFERLPPDQRRQIMQTLQHGLPGMPRALHDMMLAEFASVPASR